MYLIVCSRMSGTFSFFVDIEMFVGIFFLDIEQIVKLLVVKKAFVTCLECLISPPKKVDVIFEIFVHMSVSKLQVGGQVFVVAPANNALQFCQQEFSVTWKVKLFFIFTSLLTPGRSIEK